MFMIPDNTTKTEEDTGLCLLYLTIQLKQKRIQDYVYDT